MGQTVVIMLLRTRLQGLDLVDVYECITKKDLQLVRRHLPVGVELIVQVLEQQGANVERAQLRHCENNQAPGGVPKA